jgi:hypothetical protein
LKEEMEGQNGIDMGLELFFLPKTAHRGLCCPHQCSGMFLIKSFCCVLMSLFQVYARDVTPLPPLALPLLCGSSVAVEEEEEKNSGAPAGYSGGKGGKGGKGKGCGGRGGKGGSGGGGEQQYATICLDGWLRLQVSANAAPVVLAARRRVDAVLRSLVTGATGTSGVSSSSSSGQSEREGAGRTAGHGVSVGERGATAAAASSSAAGLLGAVGAFEGLRARAEVIALKPKSNKPSKNAKRRAKQKQVKESQAKRRYGGGDEGDFFGGGGGGGLDW